VKILCTTGITRDEPFERHEAGEILEVDWPRRVIEDLLRVGAIEIVDADEAGEVEDGGDSG
jgi:hypothetical protein